MPSLKDVFRDIEKISGASSIMEGVEVKDIERIVLPMTRFNRMLYGGLPKGRMIEFSGPEGSGKTTTALLCAAAYQKQDERPVLFVDVEGTYDAKWSSKLGVDNSAGRFIKWAPENATAEEVFEVLLKFAQTNEVGMIILDSIPALVPQQEDSKSMSEYQMGGVSKPLTVFARKLQKVLLTNDTVSFIGINQVRDNMSQYGPTTTTVGGHAWKHMCSIRIEFSSHFVDAGGNYIPETNQSPVGVKINAALKKNKTAPRDRKLSDYILNFDRGFDEIFDLVSTAKIYGIISQRGSSYSYSNSEGEVLISALGMVKFIEKLTPELIDNIRQEVEKYGN